MKVKKLKQKALCLVHFLHQNFAKVCKNTEKGHFDQHLECPAPKPWSIYTTEQAMNACYFKQFLSVAH